MEWALFDGVPAEDLRLVLGFARRRSFGRGEVVFHQDDPADSLHLVVRGRFAIARRTPLGEETLLAIRGAGDFFGELALVSGEARSATVTAFETGETLCLHRIDFDRLRAANPSVDRVLVTLLARQVQRMDTLLSEAFHQDARRRGLRRLLELGSLDDGTARQEIRITQDQLGALAGASRATVASVLAAERKRGTIKVHRGVTILLDREALRRSAALPGAGRSGGYEHPPVPGKEDSYPGLSDM